MIMLKKIQDLVIYLSDYFRYNFQDVKNFVTVREELEAAKSYVDYIGTLFQGDAKKISGHSDIFRESRSAECYSTAAMVNYNALVFRARNSRTDMLAESALANILSTGYLWEKIRMEGGAYGAGASCMTSEKLFAFTSYRDPYVERTYQIYKKALEEIVRNGISEDVLEKTVITMAGESLKPLSPGNLGFLECQRDMNGTTYELRKKRREVLLKLSVNDIIDSARYLLKEIENSSVATIAGKESLKKEKDFLKKREFKITKIRGI